MTPKVFLQHPSTVKANRTRILVSKWDIIWVCLGIF